MTLIGCAGKPDKEKLAAAAETIGQAQAPIYVPPQPPACTTPYKAVQFKVGEQPVVVIDRANSLIARYDDQRQACQTFNETWADAVRAGGVR